MNRLLPLLVALALVAAAASAQRTAQRAATATDRYHEAAQAYVGGDTAAAVQAAESGLRLDPDNQKLRDLLDLLRKDQPPQDGDDGEPDDQSENGDQDGEGDTQSDRQDPDEPERDQAEQDQTRTQPDEPDSEGDPSAQQPQRPDRQGGATPQSAGPPRPGTMSRDQALRLLDAVGAEERLLVEGQRRPSRARRAEKDW